MAANDVPDLIHKFNGQIRRFNGSSVRLDLDGASIETYAMSARQMPVPDPNLP
jgi:hypothetical protein